MATAMDYIRASNGQPPERPTNQAALQDWLDMMADLGQERLSRYTIYEEFYRGDQKTRLTERARMYLERHTGIPWRENFCEPVIDLQAERMIVTGFNHEEESIVEWCKDLWEKERMDATQQVVHSTELIKGDAFVMLDWEEPDEDDEEKEGHPCIYFNRPDLIKVCYSTDNSDEMTHAVKVWNVHEAQNMNIYFPDRIEKYFRLHKTEGKGGWQQRYDDEADTTWPQPWVDSKGKPLGIPVVHFRNRSLGRDDGFSEIDNVIPEQAELNKTVLDLNSISDSQGWRQRWVSGMDAASAGSKFKNVPGEVWAHPDTNVRFGSFDTDDPTGIIAIVENIVSRIARRSRIPLHLLTGGDMPSGEALKTAESGLVKKVEACQVPTGNSWEDVMIGCMKLQATFGTLPFEIPDRLETQWEDPKSRNELEELQAAILKRQIGVSDKTLLTEMGYDAEAEQKVKAEETEVEMERQAKMFDAGMGGGGDLFGQPKPKPKKDDEKK